MSFFLDAVHARKAPFREAPAAFGGAGATAARRQRNLFTAATALRRVRNTRASQSAELLLPCASTAECGIPHIFDPIHSIMLKNVELSK